MFVILMLDKCYGLQKKMCHFIIYLNDVQLIRQKFKKISL